MCATDECWCSKDCLGRSLLRLLWKVTGLAELRRKRRGRGDDGRRGCSKTKSEPRDCQHVQNDQAGRTDGGVDGDDQDRHRQTLGILCTIRRAVDVEKGGAETDLIKHGLGLEVQERNQSCCWIHGPKTRRRTEYQDPSRICDPKVQGTLEVHVGPVSDSRSLQYFPAAKPGSLFPQRANGNCHGQGCLSPVCVLACSGL